MTETTTTPMTLEEIKAVVCESEYVTVDEIRYHNAKYGYGTRKIAPLKLQVYNASYYEELPAKILAKTYHALDNSGTIVQDVSYIDKLIYTSKIHYVYTKTSTRSTFLVVDKTPDHVYELLFVPGAMPITLQEYEELLQSDYITVTQNWFHSIGTGKSELVACPPITYKVKTIGVDAKGIVTIEAYGNRDILGWRPQIHVDLRKGTKCLIVNLEQGKYESTVRKAKIEAVEIEMDRTNATSGH